jgi:hypothetical protein
VSDAIGAGDLAEITNRFEKTGFAKQMKNVLLLQDVPPWIKAVQRMFEAVQFRKRLKLYSDHRLGGVTRQEARKRLAESLYDYRTGVTDLEAQTVGRLAAFWTYQRNMFKQMGKAFSRSIAEPSTFKQLTGQTPTGRLVRADRVEGHVSDTADKIINEDDDKDELGLSQTSTDRLGRFIAPWWADNKWRIFAHPIDYAREQWYLKVTGKKPTHEALVMNTLIFNNMLFNVNLLAQTAGGMTYAMVDPAVTSVSLKKPVQDTIDSVTGGFNPLAGLPAKKALYGVAGIDEYQPQTEPLRQAEKLALRRVTGYLESLGMSGFLIKQNGEMRIDPDHYGMFMRMGLSYPPFENAVRVNAMIDNPSLQQDPLLAGLEGLFRASEVASITPVDAAAQRKHEVDAKNRKVQDELAKMRKALKRSAD